MSDKLLILTTTYFPSDERGKIRLEEQSIPAMKSWWHLLDYDGEIRLFIGDDGSSLQYFSSIANNVGWEEPIWSKGNREGVGASLNRGIQYAKEGNYPFIFYPVDDWKLIRKFDLTPWAKLLSENEDIGAVRLGPPHPQLRGQIMHLGSLGWALRLERYGYVASMRPTLFHQRFFEAYGPWPERMSSLETERIYSEHFNNTPGPDIVLALPDLWEPLMATEMSAMVPA